MNENDLAKLEKLNERYTEVNMTGFKLVTEKTSKDTVMKHIELDLKILNSGDVVTKHVSRVILRRDCIDICSIDNGTPVSYFFTGDAGFTPKSIEAELKSLCGELKVNMEILNGEY